MDVFIVAQNHSLGEWYKKAYGDKQEKTPFAIMEVRSANCTKKRIAKGGHSDGTE